MSTAANAQIKEEIKYYLSLCAHPHLGDCVELIPEANQVALYNLISDLQHDHRRKEVIAAQVCEDVALIIDGQPDNILYSKKYMNQ